MIYHTLFHLKIRKMLQNLSSAAVVIGTLRVKYFQGGALTKKTKGDIIVAGHTGSLLW